MADKKIYREQNSKPFSSFNFFVPFQLSICGDTNYQRSWESIFKKKRFSKREKSEIFWKQIKKDLGEDGIDELFSSQEFKTAKNSILNKIIFLYREKGNPVIDPQHLFRFIVEREYKENEEK